MLPAPLRGYFSPVHNVRKLLAAGPRAASAGLPSRDEIAEQHKWDLDPVYPTDEAWQAELARATGWVDELDAFRGRLHEDPDVLLACLRTRDRIFEVLSRLSVYASLKRDLDTRDARYQTLVERIRKVVTRAGEKASYFAPELVALDPAELERFLKQEPELGLYRHLLDDVVRSREHTLSPREEEILAMAADMSRGAYDVFSMLNNADLKFPSIQDEQGQSVELTHGRYYLFMESHDRRVRQEAFRGVLGTYEKYKNTLAAALSAQVKRTLFYARVRRYPSALHAALDDNHIPVAVFENLIAATRARVSAQHRYMKLRKRVMKLDELHAYDTAPPLVPEVDLRFEFDEAEALVKEALSPMGREYGQVIERAFRERWIDVHETPGKRSGAYSSGTYGTPPYILLNYNRTLDAVFTLAHELGHSLHSYLSQRAQPFVYSGYSIFVAEVASTASESLLMSHLLERARTPAERLYLLNHWVDQIRGTFFTQVMFAEFEWNIHKRLEAGEPLTHESLSELYAELYQAYHGEVLVQDELNRYGWSRIPHFYYNFYVYQYATGYAAASALSQGILERGDTARGPYLEFLRSGSSAYPIELLKRAGVDMSTPAPVENTIGLFERLVDEMEQLLGVRTND